MSTLNVEAEGNLTAQIRSQLERSPYVSSLRAFALDSFFLLPLFYSSTKLQMRYSTGRKELDELTFTVGATQARKTFVEEPVQRISCATAISAIFGEECLAVEEHLRNGEFFQATQNVDHAGENRRLEEHAVHGVRVGTVFQGATVDKVRASGRNT